MFHIVTSTHLTLVSKKEQFYHLEHCSQEAIKEVRNETQSFYKIDQLTDTDFDFWFKLKQ